jgi:hypothetical protein
MADEGTCLHIHDGDTHVGNICVPGRFHYLPRVHRVGAQKYELLGKPTYSLRVAFKRLTDAFINDSRIRQYNRGDILAYDDNPYYEPHVAYEVKR